MNLSELNSIIFGGMHVIDLTEMGAQTHPCLMPWLLAEEKPSASYISSHFCFRFSLKTPTSQ